METACTNLTVYASTRSPSCLSGNRVLLLQELQESPHVQQDEQHNSNVAFPSPDNNMINKVDKDNNNDAINGNTSTLPSHGTAMKQTNPCSFHQLACLLCCNPTNIAAIDGCNCLIWQYQLPGLHNGPII